MSKSKSFNELKAQCFEYTDTLWIIDLVLSEFDRFDVQWLEDNDPNSIMVLSRNGKLISCYASTDRYSLNDEKIYFPIFNGID